MGSIGGPPDAVTAGAGGAPGCWLFFTSPRPPDISRSRIPSFSLKKKITQIVDAHDLCVQFKTLIT
ncbi:hypothetical protein, partial [Clavibacter michiganensis]|uniref:hypothetical protein n=1 Tax=Clavibacter michiganensis TaxID=28447 RepID=UPI00292D6DAB